MLIHSPVDGHLECFHLWVIMTKAARTFSSKPFNGCVSVSLDRVLGVEFLGHMLSLYLTS